MSDPKVPAADNTLRILRLLSKSRGPLAASMIATQLALPRSTTYQLLSALQEHGFVAHLPEVKRYGLGAAAFELSSAYARHEPLARLGRPLISGLVDKLRQSAHLAVPHGRDVLYIVEQRAPGAPHLVSDVDVRLPMHLTASGRAILASLPKAQLRALYPDKNAFVHRHEVSEGSEGSADNPADNIDSYSKLRTVLDAGRTRGYAVEQGSVTPGFSSVAVPVLDHSGWPVAAIAVTFRDSDFSGVDAHATSAGHAANATTTSAALDALAAEVRSAAAQLSARIHGRTA